MNLKKCFRYKSVTILMIIGLTISCFVVLNGANLIEKTFNETTTIDNFKYTISTWIFLEDTEDINPENFCNFIDDLITLQNVNVSTLKLSVFLNNELNNNNIDVFFNHNEAQNIVLNDGTRLDYLEDFKEYNGSLLLGETIAKYFNVQQNDTIYIKNVPFYVMGIMKNNMSGGIDNRIYAIWGNCNNTEKEILYQCLYEEFLSGFLEIKLSSNSNLDLSYQNIINIIDKYEYNFELSKKTYHNGYQNYWYQFYSSIFITTSLIFSIITCLIVSDIWILKRKSELAIRYTFGYSKRQLSAFILKDISIILFISIIFSVIIQLIYNIIVNNIQRPNFFINFIVVFISIFIILVLISQRLINNISKISPIEAIKQGEL